MHQGHNIPWSVFETHFTFAVDDNRYTPPFTGFRYKDTPAAIKELQHFVRKFVGTINEFSKTERQKYPVKIPHVQTNDKLFSDALRDKYPDHLNKHFQSLAFWIDEKRHDPYGRTPFRDVVMVLLLENEMETLLLLAQHPQINMAEMLERRCAHYQSIRGEHTALWAYMYLNSVEAVGQLSNGNYARTREYTRLYIDGIAFGICYCGQQVAHEIFVPNTDPRTVGFPLNLIVHTDINKLQGYLKSLFALMYRFDALAREMGVDPQWERHIKDTIIYQGGLPRQFGTDERNTPFLTTLRANGNRPERERRNGGERRGTAAGPVRACPLPSSHKFVCASSIYKSWFIYEIL